MGGYYFRKMYRITIILSIITTPRVFFCRTNKTNDATFKMFKYHYDTFQYISFYMIKMLENIVIIKIENISNDTC